MEVSGPHVSPWLVHMEVVTGIPRAAGKGKFQLTGTLQASDSVSLAEASDMAQFRVSVEGKISRVRIEGDNYDHFCK